MKKLVYLTGLTIFLFSSCGKDQTAVVSISSTTAQVNDNSYNINLNVSVSGSGKVDYAGVFYGLRRDLDTANVGYYYGYSSGDNHEYAQTYLEGGKFKTNTPSISLTGLNDNSWYYYYPYCTVNGRKHVGNIDSFQTAMPAGITQGPGGGYVIYDDGMGGGIEMMPYNFALLQTTSYDDRFEWGCYGVFMQGTNTIVGSGQTNSDTISAQCPDIESAANVALGINYGGYSDWYLPSLDELALAHTILGANGLGNFNEDQLWSSSQESSHYAYTYDPSSGANTANLKYSHYKIRAVRTF